MDPTTPVTPGVKVRRRKAATVTPSAVPRVDGWRNLITRLGTAFDKRTQSTYQAGAVTWAEAEEMWRGSDMAARIIERTPDEMLRQGWDVNIPAAKDRQEKLAALLEDLQVVERFREALHYRNAYGGGGVLVGADDGATDLAKPLGVVKAIRYLTALTPRELVATEYYIDPREERYGLPKLYLLTGEGLSITVHESRCLIFQGSVTSRQQRRMCSGWGESVFVRLAPVLRDFDHVFDAASALMQDFAQPVFKVPGLAEILASDQEGAFAARMAAVEMMRSVIRAMVIDGQETFERLATPLAGLPEVMEKFMFRLAAAAEMPVSMLFGMAPAGLNATGDADTRFYYDHLKNLQDRALRPPLERLVKMALQTMGGEPDLWSLEFRPLWQLTQAESANLHIAQADAYQVYLNGGVVTADEVRRSRFGGARYSVDTVLEDGPAPGKPAVPSGTFGAPAPTPTPPNGESPDGTPPLDTVMGAGGAQ
jgi:uncharacterized protein